MPLLLLYSRLIVLLSGQERRVSTSYVYVFGFTKIGTSQFQNSLALQALVH